MNTLHSTTLRPPASSPRENQAEKKINEAVDLVQSMMAKADGQRLEELRFLESALREAKGGQDPSLGFPISNDPRLVVQYNIAHLLAEAHTITGAASQVMQLICETAGCEYGAFWQLEPDGSTLTNKGVWYAEGTGLATYADQARYSIVTGEQTTPPGYALQIKEPLRLFNLADWDPKYFGETEKVGLHSAYLLPVKSGGRVIAILECLSTHNQMQDDQLADMLNAVGEQVGIFVERKILEETLEVRANQEHLLAQAGLALSDPVELEKRLLNIAHVAVPEIADMCTIDIVDQNNILRRMAAAHVDPRKEAMLYKLQPTREISFDQANIPLLKALLTGQSLLYSEIPPDLVAKSVSGAERLEMVNQLAPVSFIIVPLIAHNQILGTFSFTYTDSLRHYSNSDLPLAEDIARRTALAVDNALLYEQSQMINTDLEKRVDERTSQLRAAINKLTNEMTERQDAEERVRILNAELEKRIAERTSQLEVVNRELNSELTDRKRTSEALKALLKQTRELYRISQTIGMVRTPVEVLSLLLSSGFLKNVSRASIAILDHPWKKEEAPPENCFILAEWNRGESQPRFLNQHFTLEEYGVKMPVHGEPIIIRDIQTMMEFPDQVRQRFAELQSHGLIILPLMASGECYGLLTLHFRTRRMTSLNGLRHVRGIVDETALVIKNMRLLETESQARREAERANDLKLKFLGMVSHELRTPLTSIKGFATTLLADDVQWPLEKQKEFLETINAESDKLHELIEELLDLSRIEAGVLRISPVKLSLKKVIDSSRSQMEILSTDHPLILEIPSELPPVFGDNQRIAQVMTNLVSNAAKFSPAGTRIIVSARREENVIHVDVADEGPGISPQDRDRIFIAFRQLENSSAVANKGAGLGLAICKALIEAHGGSIWIKDTTGPGTTISFTLPIAGEKEGARTERVMSG